jgi:hypothetical protein
VGRRTAIAALAAIVADFCAKTGACLRGGEESGLILFRSGRYARSDLNYGPNGELSFWNSLWNSTAWELRAFRAGDRWFAITTAALPPNVDVVPTDPATGLPSLDNNGHYDVFDATAEDLVTATVDVGRIPKNTSGPS